MRPPMTNGLAMFAHWSVREKKTKPPRQFNSGRLHHSVVCTRLNDPEIAILSSLVSIG